MPENVEDEQPESKEILDQVQSESKEILDQNQPKFEEILDQIQSKSEENLGQPDDTSKNELEDSKNKDWRDHHKEHNLQKKLEILKNKNQIWENKGIERKIEKIQQKIQPRTRRNSQYAPTDILNIKETFKDHLLFILENVMSINSLMQEKISKGIEEFNQVSKVIYPIIEKFITQRGEEDEIKEEVQKKIKEKFEEIIDKFKDSEKVIKVVAKDLLNNTVKKLEIFKKGIFNQLKEVTNLPEIGEAGDFLRILKGGFKTSMNVLHDTFDNVREELIKLPLTIIKAKINNFEDVKKIADIGAIAFEKANDYAEKGIKAIESEKDRIGNLLKAEAERLNDKVKLQIEKVFEEGKDKVESIGNILKRFEEPITLNGFRDLSKSFLPKIKRD